MKIGGYGRAVAEPVGSFWGYHDRLFLCRMLHGVERAWLDFGRRFPSSTGSGHALARGSAPPSIQRDDGSWYGSWGCCFTYAGWFGIEGLVDSGEDPATSEPVQRACAFFKTSTSNGGWGEDFTSCFDKARGRRHAGLRRQ